MLYAALIYCILSLVCLIAGIIFYELLPLRKPRENVPARPFIVYAITGLIFITGFAQWLALFFPLDKYSTLLVALLLLILFMAVKKRALPVFHNFYRNFKKTPVLFKIGAVVFLLMILVLNTGPVIMDDTDSYHIQMIKWLQEYGTVPGLANLHLRYGFNSSWFESIGLLSPHTGNINSYMVLNGLLSYWFCLYLFKKMAVLFSKNLPAGPVNGQLSIFILLVAAILIWPMIRGSAANTNYDFITTCCIVILFIEAGSSTRNNIQSEMVLWPIYLFTIRIINFPLLLLSLFLLWQFYRDRNFRKITAGMLTGIFLITPFIIRNVILSGYAFFPVYQVDVFSPGWKADKQMVINIVEYIKYFNRVNVMFRPLQETSGLRFPGWVQSWYHYLFVYDKLLVSVCVLCYAASLFWWKRLRQKLNSNTVLLLIVLLAQLITWFLVAPDVRFAYGPLLCGLLLFCLMLPPVEPKPVIQKVSSIVAGLILVACLAYTGGKIFSVKSYQNILLPKPLPEPALQQVTVDSITLNIPQKLPGNWNARCYGTPLPCLYNVHPGLRARGKNIADGFYIDYSIGYKPPKWVWY